LCLFCALLVSDVCAWGQSPAVASNSDEKIGFCEFLDLADPCAVRDAAGKAMLTFAAFDANDELIWARGFEGIDAWCVYARNDPCLVADRTEQAGWALCAGKEDIFWQLQAICYLCPECRNMLRAIESRPTVYDGNRRTWLTPGVATTTGENRFDLLAAVVFWNPRATVAYDGTSSWDHFPPLAALAHELVHAYQTIVEDRPTYTSPLQVPAMEYENLVRLAFHRKVPDNDTVTPRPGNAGVYLGTEFQYFFDDLDWADWSPSFVPLLDVFVEPEKEQ
ncbi:MAG: hypothetical protein ABFE01_07565, partial [Phycisphaerales bacterium]